MTPRLVCHLVMCCAACSFVLPTVAMAQSEFSNDSFDTLQQGTIASAQLITSEMYAATFTIPTNFLPAELLGVRVVMIDGDDPQKS